MTSDNLLVVEGLTTGYFSTCIIDNLSMAVPVGSCIGLIGPNGHGKTTLLRAITGALPCWAGSVTFDDERIDGWPTFRIARAGLVHVPQGDLLFGELSVRDNLLAAATKSESWRQRDDLLERVYETLPMLKDIPGQTAMTLSGGQRRMLAIGRGLMMQARLMIVDEPSLGLAPAIIETVYERLGQLREAGLSLILVEEKPDRLTGLADLVYLIDAGRILAEGTLEEISADPQILRTYLGGSVAAGDGQP